MSVAFGIDFGTSNSAVAMAEGEKVRLVEWPVPPVLSGAEGAGAVGKLSSTLPTVLFAPEHDRGLLVGHEAIARYLYAGFEGRFIQSIKAFLPQASFSGTAIRGRHLSIEEIVAAFLVRLREGAELSLGRKLDGPLIFGRPARFSADPEADRLAEERLKKAIGLAGFRDFQFLIEPVAAALAYEATLGQDEIVFVADLGGGTTDFTLMQVGPSHRGTNQRRQTILASGGLSVAGDAFDGQIVESQLFEPFGRGTTYKAFGAPTPVPHWIFQKLKRWNHVSFLKSKKYLDFLKEVHVTCDRPEAIGRLIRVVDEDLGYLMFRAVERAKRTVHETGATRIADEANDLPLDQGMDVAQFRGAARPLLLEIQEVATQVLKEAQLGADRVDAVFLTGGTSLIPEVRETFATMFGADRLRSHGTFTSVVDGLARGANLAE
jgi:hypothetical chaperone protein